MVKKIVRVFLLGCLLIAASCKDKNCNFGTPVEVYKKYPLPDNSWFDSIEDKGKYRYIFNSKTGLSDALMVFRSDLHDDDGGWENCNHIKYINARVIFSSINYGYDFDFEIADVEANNKGVIIVSYSSFVNKQYNFFYQNPFDTTKHKIRVKNYSTGFDSTLRLSSQISFLPEFINTAGLTFKNVYKYSPVLSPEKGNIKEFYANKELGLIEYSTNEGITYSYIRREFY